MRTLRRLSGFGEVRHRDLVKRVDGGLQMPARQVKIDCCLLQTLVSEQQLNRAQVGARLQHVRCKAVSKGVRPETFRDAGAKRRFVTGIPNRFIGDWLFFRGRFPVTGKQVYTRLDFALAPVPA